MSALVVNLTSVFGCAGLLAGGLYGVSFCARRGLTGAEVARKLIHVGLGLACLAFPLLFVGPSATGAVWLACALGAGLFAAARGPLRAMFGAGLHAVARRSHGEFYFALSVAVLFALRAPQSQLGEALYVAPIAVLAVSDAAAALIGARFGRVRFKTLDGEKSLEGVAAFMLSAALVSFASLTLLAQVDLSHALALSLSIALFGAALEAMSWRGLDNLFIPLGVYALLACSAGNGAPNVATMFGFAASGAAALILMTSGRAGRRTAQIALGAAAALIGLASLAAATP